MESSVARLEECASSPPCQIKVEPEDGELSDNTDPGEQSDNDSDIVELSQPAPSGQTSLEDLEDLCARKKAEEKMAKEKLDKLDKLEKKMENPIKSKESLSDEDKEKLEDPAKPEERLGDEEEEKLEDPAKPEERLSDEEEEKLEDPAKPEEPLSDEEEEKLEDPAKPEERLSDEEEDLFDNPVNSEERLSDEEVEKLENPVNSTSQIVPETQFEQSQVQLKGNEDTSAVDGLNEEMSSREQEGLVMQEKSDLDDNFTQIDVDFNEINKFEQNASHEDPTISQAISIINAPDENIEDGERPVTPGRDLPESTSPHVTELQEESLEGMSQGEIVCDEPSRLVLMPPSGPVSSKIKAPHQDPNKRDVIASTSASATASASASTLASASASTLASASASASTSKSLKRKEKAQVMVQKPQIIVENPQVVVKKPQVVAEKPQLAVEVKKKIALSPLAKPVKEIKSAKDAGFPSSQKQTILPEKKPKKFLGMEVGNAKKPRLDETSSRMPLKDVNGKWEASKVSPNMAAMYSHLPPLAGEKRALPSVNELPLMPGKIKENKVIHVPPTPAKHQSSITAHTVHQFKPMETGGSKFKVPAVVKVPTKNLGKFSNKLPKRMKHRACTLCLKVYPSKASRNPGGLTPHLHVITSECPFVRANVVNVVNNSVCYGCFERFEFTKSVNEDVVSHFEMTDHDVICHLCRQVMPYSRVYSHLVEKFYGHYESGVACNRCSKSFFNCQAWVEHIKTDHISKPNLAHFNRYLPIVKKQLHIREQMLFSALHYNAS